MKILGVIPARYASTRFPGKPLIDIGGKSMIQRVYEQSKKANGLMDVVVATDDARIQSHVHSFGGKVVMTKDTHQSGTDRCFETVHNYGSEVDVVINIQGDEPFIRPEQIDLVASCFDSPDVEIATLIKKITDTTELFNVNTPKVIVNTCGDAIYFSRQTIPFIRGKEHAEWLNSQRFYKHIGIYAYTTKVLAKITALPQSSLELSEGLEQLRWIENGFRIKTKITDFESIAVDVPDDVKKLAIFL